MSVPMVGENYVPSEQAVYMERGAGRNDEMIDTNDSDQNLKNWIVVAIFYSDSKICR